MNLEQIRARCTEEGDCWIWGQGATGRGMPQMRYLGLTMHPRRAVLHIKNGHFPKVMAVATCGNTMCCSPHCAIPATASTRARYAEASGVRNRAASGRKGAISKRAVSAWSDSVIALVRESPLPAKKIAAEVGMSWSHAKAIRAGKARRDYASPFAGLGA